MTINAKSGAKVIKKLETWNLKLDKFFAFDAKVGMNSGAMFGKGGIGFMRMNVGCPRSVVNEAIDRIIKAVKEL